MQQPPDERLFSDFPEVTRQEWEKKIREDLKDPDHEKKLVWHTREGFDVKAFYCAEDLQHLKYLEGIPGEFPYVRTGKTELNKWEIRQDITIGDPEKANKTALRILKKGVTSLGLKTDGKMTGSAKRLSLLLKGIPLDRVTINLLTGKDTPKVIEYMFEEISRRKLDANELKGSFDFDPIGSLTINGNFYHSLDTDFNSLKILILRASGTLSSYKVVEVNGLNFSNAGANIVQELAFVLSMGNDYLAALTERGLKADDIAPRMHFVFGIGSDYFMEIAKLRAARLLWAQIVKAYHPEDDASAGMFIHAVTTRWNRTLCDPYVNMLRSTTESMSAILGGADSVEITPFDSAYAVESEFSLRNARNTQILLKEEASFDKVIDPAAGSYYIENLTHHLVQKAWDLFLETEDKGGYIKAFRAGFIQEILAKTARQRMYDIATGQEVLVGTNKYPDQNKLQDNKTELTDQKEKQPEGRIARPITLLRGGAEFEKQCLKS
ncbi:MAG: methylmalonyl-CoA mutase subunit beta [Bacteroidales bacterium]|nr:methylmalonyl-CoA mutase subunit beta [Bacteroidales bacterium]